MPLVTNRCQKHGNAYPEDNCPFCLREKHAAEVAASKEFFENYGRAKIELIPGRIIRVEDLYQHFRARLIEELTPTLMKISETAHDLAITAYNRG